MKYKILLGLGSLATIVAPISTIIACGKDAKTKATPAKTDQQIVDEAKEAFVNASSSKDKTALATSMDGKAVANPVTIAELGYTAPSLAEGVSATYAIKTIYNATSKKVVIIVTIIKGDTKTTQELEITAMTDVAVANAAVQALKITNQNVRVDPTKLPSTIIAILPTSIIAAGIKARITNEEAKALILASNISLVANDIAGTITITITGYGADKVLIASGFKKAPMSLQTEVDKLQDFETIDVANKSGNDFTTLTPGDTNVKVKFMLISDYASANKLYSSPKATDISIAKVVIKTAYNSTTKTIVFVITLAKIGVTDVANNTKEITVTFN